MEKSRTQLPYNSLALFVKITECKSYSKAAKLLGIPISTLSRRISDLENNLGIRLIDRSTRKFRLTRPGEVYFEYCKRGLDELDHGTAVLLEKQQEDAGFIRLSIPPGIGDTLIMPLICEFQKKFPNATFKVNVNERNLDLIENNIDMAFRVGPLANSSAVARHLLSYRHLLLASPEYLDKFGSPQTPDELLTHRVCTFNGWCKDAIWELQHIDSGDTERIALDVLDSANEYASIRYAALRGHCIAGIPSIICHNDLTRGDLREIMTSWRFKSRELYIIYSNKLKISRLAQRFIEFCQVQIENHRKEKPFFTGYHTQKPSSA